MNPSSNSPPIPTLSAPNKTFASRNPPRRSSTFQSSSPAPVSPISPLNHPSPTSPQRLSPNRDLDFASATFPHPQQQQLQTAAHSIKQTIASTTSTFLLSNKQPQDPAHAFFTPAQTSALKTLCSPAPLTIDQTLSLWHTLFDDQKFPSIHDAYDLEMATIGLSIDLAANNIRTRNFNKLVLHLLSQLDSFRKTRPETVPTQTYNALFLTRVFAKHFMAGFENLTLEPAKLPISDTIKNDSRPRTEQLLDMLLSILTNTDYSTNYSTYELYVEVLNILIVLLSTQMHKSRVADKNLFLDILLQQFSDRADAIVAKLLQNFVDQKMPPPQSSSK
ncbi:hypothetical protein BCR43DRAFT_329263 [Syncephalastrum racemosum]|uniref:Dymeclin n=1 Tax=Syncephalastrum racemosum TaxID=13706 RepID=A0A1X2H7X9_SYNRA|nr:hypothetical protein BCR43DRAFT_329263 [Syncephalastrum racemosum]